MYNTPYTVKPVILVTFRFICTIFIYLFYIVFYIPVPVKLIPVVVKPVVIDTVHDTVLVQY